MRLFAFFLTLLLLLWYGASSYWYVCVINPNDCSHLTWASFWNNNSEVKTPTTPSTDLVVPPLVLNDNGKTILNTPHNFTFTPLSDQLQVNSELNIVLNKLSNYLKANPNKTLEILAEYGTNENRSNGTGRAIKVQQLLANKGVSAEQLTINTQKLTSTIEGSTYAGGIKLSLNTKIDEPAMPPLTLLNGTDTVMHSHDNFKFALSSPTSAFTNDLSLQFNGLANYLKKDSTKQLIITGNYGSAETNPTTFSNLGEARADQIKQRLIAGGANATQIFTASKIDNSINPNISHIAGGIDFVLNSATPTAIDSTKTAAITAPDSSKTAAPKTIIPPAIVIKDGQDTLAISSSDFGFKKSSADAEITPEIQKSLDVLSNYLTKNKDRELDITANYAADEKNNSTFADLGKARAESVKKSMKNMPNNRVSTQGKLDKNIRFDNDSFDGGVDFTLKITEKLAENLQKLSRKLYFKTGSSTIEVTPELEKYFKDVKTYLAQDSKKKVYLTGHTDNVGDPKQNQNLGLQRAKTIKEQLTKINIDANRIVVNSKGQSQPIKPNTSPGGRGLNRRVEMIMK